MDIQTLENPEQKKSEQAESLLEGLRQKLAVMRWDQEHDQLNPAMKTKLQRLQEECDRLERELSTMRSS
ncbi:MAG TPA: hypothetical protein VJK72_05390 [Candidatus Nanoarchaeia archaeon]|nr:hypothetical protein [Candidatus Nanoarchaeia archaeon]